MFSIVNIESKGFNTAFNFLETHSGEGIKLYLL